MFSVYVKFLGGVFSSGFPIKRLHAIIVLSTKTGSKAFPINYIKWNFQSICLFINSFSSSVYVWLNYKIINGKRIGNSMEGCGRAQF